jgi:hypothetical protein
LGVLTGLALGVACAAASIMAVALLCGGVIQLMAYSAQERAEKDAAIARYEQARLERSRQPDVMKRIPLLPPRPVATGENPAGRVAGLLLGVVFFKVVPKVPLLVRMLGAAAVVLGVLVLAYAENPIVFPRIYFGAMLIAVAASLLWALLRAYAWTTRPSQAPGSAGMRQAVIGSGLLGIPMLLGLCIFAGAGADDGAAGDPSSDVVGIMLIALTLAWAVAWFAGACLLWRRRRRGAAFIIVAASLSVLSPLILVPMSMLLPDDGSAEPADTAVCIVLLIVIGLTLWQLIVARWLLREWPWLRPT